jgi:hypothetical protein
VVGVEEGGGTPGLPRGGKAQDGVIDWNLPSLPRALPDLAAQIAACPDCIAAKKHAYSDATTPGFFYTECEKHRHFPRNPRDPRNAAGVVTEMTSDEAKRKFPDYQKNRGERVPPKSPEWSEERMKELAEAEPGGLMAINPEFLPAIRKEAEVDGRTAARAHAAGVELDREILIRWGLVDNYKPRLENADGSQRKSTTGESRGNLGQTPATNPQNNVDPQHVDVPASKPKVDIAALKEICAGNLPKVPEEAFTALAAINAATNKMSGVDPQAFTPKLCVACEAPLQMAAGKMACRDEACGMYGKIQKGKP